MQKGGLNNIIRIPASIKNNFFRLWLEFLSPFHKLTSREMDIAALFIKYRYELKKVVEDPALLEEIVMNENTKRKIREEAKITVPHFQVVMGKLRKAKFIVDNKINPKFIPKGLDVNSKSFQLLLYFDLNE